MSLIIAIPKESGAEEMRVALDPANAERLLAMPGIELRMQAGCGRGAGFYDDDYQNVSAVPSFTELVAGVSVVVKVTPPTVEEASQLPEGCILVSQMSAFQHLDVIDVLLERQVTTLAMDLVPRITRAQPMDVLSSQATVGGYKAALLAAELSPRMFPMLTTAAGTIRPSRVIVIGAGVAGLQAIATARRLGAQVEAYDIRRAAKEQIESLGARMIDTGVEAEGTGGYARGLSKEEKQKQHDVLAERMSHAHAVICTAAIPGRHAPGIITEDMVEGMLPDTVIVDMAADTGGNCELTRPGESYMHGDTLIIGPLNLPSSGAVHASEMYARNVFSMLNLFVIDGELQLDWQDEILARCLLTHAGEMHHAHTAELMKLPLAVPLTDRVDATTDEPDQAAGWIAEDESRPVASDRHEVVLITEDENEAEELDILGGSLDSAITAVSTRRDEPATSNSDHGGDSHSVTSDTPLPDAEKADESPENTDPSDDGSTADQHVEEEQDPPDDFTLIDGIGPAVQSQMYAFGITRYAQIVELDAVAAERLEQQLELDGNIDRDDWRTQAARLDQQS